MKSFIAKTIAEFPHYPSAESVEAASSELGLSPSAFCDAFAQEVVSGYLSERYTWAEGDKAMNSIWCYICLSLIEHTAMPNYAFGVFLAFDAGEVVQEKSSDARTKELLSALHEKA